jgi:hypothetical protein
LELCLRDATSGQINHTPSQERHGFCRAEFHRRDLDAGSLCRSGLQHAEEDMAVEVEDVEI